ncbi:hypothetical protein [Undibacterium sp. Tian12W]|uniref:hypothetical protein n=1 Tax=Undibacterium sp. Tian12W TaxID=3413054 RepID=UPI003BF2EF30
MIEIPLGKFFATMNQISTFSQVAEMQISNKSVVIIDEKTHADFVVSVNEFIGICEAVGLQATQLAAQDFCKALTAGKINNNSFEFSFAQLAMAHGSARAVQNCLKYESSIKVGLILHHNKIELFSPRNPLFGHSVQTSFPNIKYEIDEAGKCLALGRSTATVFHLMRIMETALRSIYLCLSIQAPLTGNNKNWGNILQAIKTEIARRGNNWSEKEYFNEIYAMVAAVKDAWRNTTMHVEKIYTEHEASVLFEIINAFMKKIASRLDENGQPLA